MKPKPLELPELTRNQKEFKLQCHIVEKHRQYFPHVLMTAFPARPGDAEDGFFKKMMGVRAGVSDILLWWRESPYKISIRAGCVELKVDSAPSSAQNKWLSAFDGIGGSTGVAKSWEQYYKLLCSWNIKPTEPCTLFTELDYRTVTQKYKDAHEMYRP